METFFILLYYSHVQCQCVSPICVELAQSSPCLCDIVKNKSCVESITSFKCISFLKLSFLLNTIIKNDESNNQHVEAVFENSYGWLKNNAVWGRSRFHYMDIVKPCSHSRNHIYSHIVTTLNQNISKHPYAIYSLCFLLH